MGLVSATAAAAAQTAAAPGIAPAAVRSWVERSARMCRPDRIVWIDGSADQRAKLIKEGIAGGVFIRLNQASRPNCYLHRSNPNDVARTEQLTFICTPSEDLAGPTNNWMESKSAYAKLRTLFDGCMVGRTMYVVPFVMGPIGSHLAKVGVQITDSVYVAVSMQIMTRAGDVAWSEMARLSSNGNGGGGDEFTRCLHSLGDVSPTRRYICHFPLDNVIWSFGSGYGGNALLGKKSLALRIASFMGSQQEWMAEHMLCVGATDPEGKKKYVAAAFPSASGKTNFAMLIPPERYRKQGWKITTVGDDIVWMWVDSATGKLRAINPEAGYFGVLPGTNEQTNPNAMATMAHDTIFTNVALLPDGDVWWEGKTPDPPASCIDWRGQPWTPNSPTPAAHPNSRFTAPMINNPALDPEADDPAGVPISAIIFGGRRTRDIPLVYQAFNWIHGVYVGATLASETTAAATGALGVVRRDPMAMLPFLGYNIRDYLVHWFRMRKKMADCPRIFHVNWFRKDDTGKFIWPGFGDNMRVLKWILDRCAGRAYAVETPLGWMPRPEDIDLTDSSVTIEQLRQIQTIDLDAVRRELLNQEELFLKLAGDLPKEMIFQRELLISRL